METKSSVLIAVFNGEKYLIKQLDSIRMQTRQPEEVIISDDCSTDNSVKIINEYIKKYNLNDTWKLLVCESNQGWKKNFINLIKESSNDLLFLCDQDDIWSLDKIERMVSVFDKKEMKLLVSNYNVFFSGDCSNYKTDWGRKINDGSIKKIKFDTSFFYVKRPGCTYCVDGEFARMCTDYWFEGCPHDALLWRLAATLDGLYLFNTITLNYRRHDENASGREKKNNKVLENTLKYYEQMLDVISVFCNNSGLLSKEKNKILNKWKEFCNKRIKWCNTHSLIYGLNLLLYIRYYATIKQYIGDWYRIYHK